jgi:allophanate hydrolase
MGSDATPFGRTLAQLHADYLAGTTTVPAVISAVLADVERTRGNNAWISVAPEEALMEQARRLEALSPEEKAALPLLGVPIAVKDNIDVAGFATTNACPDFAYRPERSATAAQRVVDAGAIVIGKTNLDQFATGLVGVRSPYGYSESVFGQGIVSGGSSSGSALVVASGVVPVALATDTAGSGRVPAALNGIVGIKPTLGIVSTVGLLPACRTIDGVTVMGTTVDDARAVLEVIVGPDPDNPWGREDATLHPAKEGPLRIGLPPAEALEFFGDEPMRETHLAARAAAVDTVGATGAPVDLEPFLEAGALLYNGAWVAERLADIGPFLHAHPESVHPVVRSIIEGGAKYTAAEQFRTEHRLKTLRHVTKRVWADVDALLLPTIGTTFTIDEVLAEPIARNAALGHYTHFANLLDLAAVAVPAGTTTDGRPASLMLIGPPHSDLTLASIAVQIAH